MWQSLGSLNIFNTITWKQFFWKNENFSKKIEYSFLVKSTKIQNADVKSKWRVQNWHITKSRVLLVTTLFFLKFCFSLKTPAQMPIVILFASTEKLFEGAFSPWVSLSSTHSIVTYLKVQLLEKGDSSKRKWTVVLFSKFYGKIWVGFWLNTWKQHVFMWKSLEILNVFNTLKLVSAIFYQIFIFSLNNSPSKTM